MRGLMIVGVPLLACLLVAGIQGTGAQSFEDRVALAESEAFQRRLTFAITKAALAVAAETPDADPDRAALRYGLAQEVLRDPHTAAERFSLPMVTNMAITAESTDSDLEWQVSAVWDALAGVRTPPPDPEEECP